ncbi:unnamed protein product [Psylliodes chrysocephalus]|uniref:Uncharacterized protein n=1 Tax=Psylliodes chrysocephalus TaxID=3402493 RepID=A0A9P0CW43_9CUCU|nr:unnamed protein product [Psylliodes chrysocephala]
MSKWYDREGIIDKIEIAPIIITSNSDDSDFSSVESEKRGQQNWQSNFLKGMNLTRVYGCSYKNKDGRKNAYQKLSELMDIEGFGIAEEIESESQSELDAGLENTQSATIDIVPSSSNESSVAKVPSSSEESSVARKPIAQKLTSTYTAPKRVRKRTSSTNKAIHGL